MRKKRLITAGPAVIQNRTPFQISQARAVAQSGALRWYPIIACVESGSPIAALEGGSPSAVNNASQHGVIHVWHAVSPCEKACKTPATVR